MKKTIISDIIYPSIEEIKDTLPNSGSIILQPSTVLFGNEAILDSLGLVTFIVSVEQTVNEKYDTNITLADEKAMSRKNSPFRNIDTLSDYIVELLK
jgi:acyl carrier protein